MSKSCKVNMEIALDFSYNWLKSRASKIDLLQSYASEHEAIWKMDPYMRPWYLKW